MILGTFVHLRPDQQGLVHICLTPLVLLGLVWLALGGNLFAYWNSDKMVLSMYGAEQVVSRVAASGNQAGDQISPVMAMLDGGGYVVAYTDTSDYAVTPSVA